ncbi:MAG: porin [Syntrophobacteria bacterium]
MCGRLLCGSVLAALFLSFALRPAPVQARGYEEEISELKQQLKILQERIEKLEKKRDREEAEKLAKMKAYWKNGFRIEYEDPETDREYKFRFRTGIQFRYTYVDTDDDILFNGSPTGKDVDHTENYNSFNMRRLRFYVDGTAPTADWNYYVHVQLEPQSAVNIHDAFIQWQHWKEFRIQFGRMKIPCFGMEYWQSGFAQNGTDRTMFTGDSEFDQDLFGQRTYDFPGSNARLRVGNQRLDNGFSTGGFTLYRSQGLNLNGYLDVLGQKQFLAYWLGMYNGRDSRGFNNPDDQMLYSFRLGINFLPGSDPEGPMGKHGFDNYFTQGDYGYNTEPLAAFITSTFWDRDKTRTRYAVCADPEQGFMQEIAEDEHDIENYGYSASVLFRYLGFSADLEYAWEEFLQSPGRDHEESWDRWAVRANLGYFLVPQKWETVFKFAYVQRLDDTALEDHIESGLGLVKLDDGFAIEKNIQQYVFGLNYYLHGFNQYITADLALMRREFDKVSAREANSLDLDPAAFSTDCDTQNDLRFRMMYQFFF